MGIKGQPELIIYDKAVSSLREGYPVLSCSFFLSGLSTRLILHASLILLYLSVDCFLRNMERSFANVV